jgi:hypothetical protein
MKVQGCENGGRNAEHKLKAFRISNVPSRVGITHKLPSHIPPAGNWVGIDHG